MRPDGFCKVADLLSLERYQRYTEQDIRHEAQVLHLTTNSLSLEYLYVSHPHANMRHHASHPTLWAGTMEPSGLNLVPPPTLPPPRNPFMHFGNYGHLATMVVPEDASTREHSVVGYRWRGVARHCRTPFP